MHDILPRFGRIQCYNTTRGKFAQMKKIMLNSRRKRKMFTIVVEESSKQKSQHNGMERLVKAILYYDKSVVNAGILGTRNSRAVCTAVWEIEGKRPSTQTGKRRRAEQTWAEEGKKGDCLLSSEQTTADAADGQRNRVIITLRWSFKLSTGNCNSSHLQNESDRYQQLE
uniref:Uncharacterized protein n=1 Tax=Setaria digitata TaxID=48799 RepID=A0A915Q0I4_9BILA